MPVPLTSVASNQDMPEYSNLPQPRQQASIASAAAAVAAAAQQAQTSASSFNSKRSRHSSLWSLQDEQSELDEQSTLNASDMVNYANDPFGHSVVSSVGEFSSGILRDDLDGQMRTTFHNNTRHSNTSSEALN